MSKQYDENSIQSLNARDFTRLRPGVYAGSLEYSTQLLLEIVSNAIDEFKRGNGNLIEIKSYKDGSYSVLDHGQGFLINQVRPEDGKTILQAAFDTLNTSGKFTEDGVYEGTALGLNGIGSKLVNFLAHWLEVTSYRDGKFEKVYFKEGIFDKREIGTCEKNKTGTLVHWLPSEEFFVHPEVDNNKTDEMFAVLASLCQGLTIKYNDKTYYSDHGLEDLLQIKDKNIEITPKHFVMNFENGKNKINLAMTYTSQYSSTIKAYVNTGETDSGPQISLIKTAITREFNKFFRDKKWLKEKEDNLTGDDIQEGMILAYNITTSGVSYDAQTKTRIVQINMTPFITPFTEQLRSWLEANEKDIKIVADKALTARKAREAARKARETARNTKKTTGLKSKMQLSDKFIDCVSKDPEKRNLIIVEGLSRGSSAIEARNVQTDSIYMLRGKIISPLKTEVTKILQNQEMSDIIRVIGAGFGKDFDVTKMQYDKIVITSDADSDGSDIALLLTTFFFTYMRPLVEQGKLYRAVTPLYIVKNGKEELYFYTEEEMAEYRRTHSSGFSVIRAKGLGELNRADLKKVCFENQRFKRITVSDVKEAEKLLNILQGPQVRPRKQYIYDNANRLGFDFQ